MPISPEARRQRAQLACATRYGRIEAAEDAARQFKVTRLAEHIQEAVDTAPLPTPEEMTRLRHLLRPRP
ncbi:hypothetical protein QF034_001137 [Streptomyces africanus]|uniref:Uncharacterized protein n=1 Tax=Streptomyces africanus TaxID=231024 RepID=A0ABU0QHQ2_9ACTN|nr:hypothetical protein [Streptomyces africanus]MDQ0746906.1 hypothetical protein [Streptomyces africanus]